MREELEPALRTALADASALRDTAVREETARAEAELRARTATESHTLELEAARSCGRTLDDRVAVLEKVGVMYMAGNKEEMLSE